jgi:hypothetical protein
MAAKCQHDSTAKASERPKTGRRFTSPVRQSYPPRDAVQAAHARLALMTDATGSSASRMRRRHVRSSAQGAFCGASPNASWRRRRIAVAVAGDRAAFMEP